MEDLDQLRDAIKEEADTLSNSVLDWKDQMLKKIENAKNDAILNEIKKLNERVDRLAARLPEHEED